MAKSFVKWPGGKTDELSIIYKYMPDHINNYIEPFLGGGACFLSLRPEQYNCAYINDYSNELISLYMMIKNRNELFVNCLYDIWHLWNYTGILAEENYEIIRQIYSLFKNDEISYKDLTIKIDKLIDKKRIEIEVEVRNNINIITDDLIKEIKKSLKSKLRTIKNNEMKKQDLPEEDYHKNFEAGFKAGVYTFYRKIYNKRDKLNISHELHIALFFYLREFCYSSMFRYNKSGEFNVPYGGASYNSKGFITKINYFWSQELQDVLQEANIYNLDFEEFFRKLTIEEDDFVFLDPPYDTTFSKYANNDFTSEDQVRLANYLINECKGKFMMIIKNTDFIYNLYNREGINIIGFDKKYKVSFQDRNDKQVEHIIIKNY
ncbi:DNA adenine methylase [Terrisporobacter muris]|uniref:site-specific DNA-methyltransferase (adenine-specific) n=1 Tax=Terrisporobacter muris TaxID=2963284 RepID=A0A9X2M9K5_9FIRM|nr:DNA adenine methylase [Terrisporobacter muris]MCR1822113.1 DNA adenine methylase [Terrisporobacter muris]